jgi:hypothetical protein
LAIWPCEGYALCEDLPSRFVVGETNDPGPCAGRSPGFDARSFGNPQVADILWNHIPSARGSEENGMETMKIHVLERALTAACIVAAIAVVWWGFKILAA